MYLPTYCDPLENSFKKIKKKEGMLTISPYRVLLGKKNCVTSLV